MPSDKLCDTILGKRNGLDELSDFFCHYGNSYVPIFYTVFLKLDTIDPLPLFKIFVDA